MLIDNPEKTYAFLRLTLCIRCIVGYYLKLSVSICFPLHEIVYCSIARVTISSFIAIIAGAIISMKIADCSARRNREPQFPPLMSTTTWSWGTPGTISLQHNQRRGKRGIRHSGEFRGHHTNQAYSKSGIMSPAYTIYSQSEPIARQHFKLCLRLCYTY